MDDDRVWTLSEDGLDETCRLVERGALVVYARPTSKALAEWAALPAGERQRHRELARLTADAHGWAAAGAERMIALLDERIG